MEVSKSQSDGRRGSKSGSGVSLSESKLGSMISCSSVSGKEVGEEGSQSIAKESNELKMDQPVEGSKETKSPPSELSLKLKFLLDHWITQIVMTTLTFYILFADDFKMILTYKTADNAFSGVCVAIMFIFTVEFVISAFVVPDYFLGFYFWLDFVSLLSMLLDVHWFYDEMINLMTGQSSTGSTGVSNIKSIGAIAKLGRAAKVGSRAIRILRILRIIRLVRISKLYKASEKLIEEKVNKEMKALQKKKEEEEKAKRGSAGNINNEEEMNINSPGSPGNPLDNNNNKPGENEEETPPEQVQQESKVGNKLTDLTTRRVIILVLSMMMGIILFNPTFYYTQVTSMDFGLTVFKYFDSISDPNFNLTFNIYVNEHLNISSPIIFAQVGYLSYGNLTQADTLRDAEKVISSADCTGLIPDNEDYSVCTAIFDNKSGSQLSSILNMMKTIFICIVLTCGAVCFSKDTSEMVLQPIESMIQKIKEISKNPLEAMQNNEKEQFAKSLLEEEEKEKAGCTVLCGGGGNDTNNTDSKKNKNKEAPLETAILENTITKIGALLALGFGEAGSEIIAQNMQNNVNGDVNPMLPGKKVMAIYGFCDIRNFTDTTEVLQEKVMIFVNEIAEIVHDITAEHCGSANKNIGDAFLLIWKFEDKFVKCDEETKELQLIPSKSVSQICDLALISFIKILAKVHKSSKLDKYRKNKKLNDRIPNYSVKMGFGLHLGWSIEGAIGSCFKIDASYLSPHVNTASHLEEKTKEYGVQLVISGEFIKYCSDDARRAARIIDQSVDEHGHVETVYTVDIDTNALKIEVEEPSMGEVIGGEGEVKNDDVLVPVSGNSKSNQVSEKKLEKFKKRLKRKMNYEDAVNCVRNVWQDFEEGEEDYQIMRRKYKPEFYELYNRGFEHFQAGEFTLAKAALENAQDVLRDKDGPTENLLRLMKEQMNMQGYTHSDAGNIIRAGHTGINDENELTLDKHRQVMISSNNEDKSMDINQEGERQPTHEEHPDGWIVKKINK